MNCWMEQRKRRIRRRRIVRAFLGLLGLAAGVALGGMLLPVEDRSTVSATLDRSPETVWRVLTDPDGMPLWRSDVRGVERLPDLDGRQAWREIGRGGVRVVEITAAQPPYRLVIRRLGESGPGLPELAFDLSALGGGTRITLTERRATRNPLSRVLVRMGGHAGIAGRYLQDLESRMHLNRPQVAAGGVSPRGD